MFLNIREEEYTHQLSRVLFSNPFGGDHWHMAVPIQWNNQYITRNDMLALYYRDVLRIMCDETTFGCTDKELDRLWQEWNRRFRIQGFAPWIE